MTDILDPKRNAERRRTVLATMRRSMGVTGDEAPRKKTVQDRLAEHPAGVIPARGQLEPAAQVDLFETMIVAADATVTRVADAKNVPDAVSDYLRQHNLPQQVTRGADQRLKAMPFEKHGTLEVAEGIGEDQTAVGLSHAFSAVAETGTLLLTSGIDNPTTLNFLPEDHIVVLDAKDVTGDFEESWVKIRDVYGPGRMPRTVNMITGPSRSADIEQTLFLGAHGPRRLHVIIVE